MDEFPGLLARDFGFRPQGKSAPMSAAKTGTGGASRSFVPARSRSDRSGGWISGDRPSPGYDDVFSGPPKYSNLSPQSRAASSSAPFEPVFYGFKDPAPKHSSLPVYDKPVYDDDIFDGVPLLKNPSAEKFDNVFAMMSSASASRKGSSESSPPYDDLLGSLGREMPEVKGSAGGRSQEVKEQDMSGFEELLTRFGTRSSPQQRVSLPPPEMWLLKVATCNLNQWAMDFDNNFRNIKKSISRAKAASVVIRIGPELEITGYGCEDHFFEQDTVIHAVSPLTSEMAIDTETRMRKAGDAEEGGGDVVAMQSRLAEVEPSVGEGSNSNTNPDPDLNSVLIPEDNYDWSCYRDDKFLQQQSAIREEAGKVPFIGDKIPLCGNPIHPSPRDRSCWIYST